MGELKTIMTKIESGVLQVPGEVKGIFGHDTKLVIGTAAVIAFSGATSYADILRSLELIHDNIQFRASKEKSEAQKSRNK